MATSVDPRTPGARAPDDGDVIEFRGVSKRFWKGDRPVDALGQVSLAVRAEEFLGIIGPSGCGKSTLLNMAAGLQKPSSGEVLYHGRPVRDVNTDVGYLTQKDSLIPWRTVAGNVGLPLEVRGVGGQRRRELVASWVQLVGLQGFEHHYPSELSGGMRKRAALARMLVYDPGVLLMDEPFGALDAQLRLVLHEELLRIWGQRRKTIVFVTHDLTEAISLADRVVVFSARPGRITLIEEVQLPRPRQLERLRAEPRFGELHDRLWTALRDDVRRGEANQ